MTQKKSYHDVVLEDINGKFDTLLEIVVPMQRDVATLKEDVAVLKEDVAELKSDVRTIKAALTVTSTQVHDHERRITNLEVKTA